MVKGYLKVNTAWCAFLSKVIRSRHRCKKTDDTTSIHYMDKLLIWDRSCPGLPTLHNRGHLTRPPYNYCYTQVIERRQGVPITNRNSPEHSLSGLRAIYSSKYFIRYHCTIPKACVNVVLLDTQNKYNMLHYTSNCEKTWHVNKLLHFQIKEKSPVFESSPFIFITLLIRYSSPINRTYP